MPYIPRPNDFDLSLPAIYTQKNANARIFMFGADLNALKGTVDHYLNPVTATNTHYTPLGNVVIASFMAIQEIRCSINDLGSMHEVDCAFFVPLLKWVNWFPTDVAFFPLYLFVNNPWAMATGREVHGFRKDMAVSFNDGLDVNDESSWNHQAADLTHIRTWTMKNRNANERLALKTIVEVNAPAPPTPLQWVVSAFADMVMAMMGNLGDLGEALDSIPMPQGSPSLLEVVRDRIIDAMTGTDTQGNPALRVPIVLLRQFRDPTDSLQADVQEIVEVDMLAPLSSISGSPVGGGFKMRFHHAASHPIAQELGLSAVENSILTVDATLDFELPHA